MGGSREEVLQAFLLDPEAGFKQEDGFKHSILFDHTLITGKDDYTGITFRCGNIMGLSTPSKGLPNKGVNQDTYDKYREFFADVGKDITFAWFNNVNDKLQEITDKPEGFSIPKTYQGTGRLIDGSYKTIYTTLHDKLLGPSGEDLKDFLNNNIFSYKDEESLSFPAKFRDVSGQEEIFKKLEKSIKDSRDKSGYARDGRLDKAYQLLFDNKVWQTQKFGGFDMNPGGQGNDKPGPYAVFLDGKVDDENKIIDDAAEQLRNLIEQSIKDVDVLFLCESVHNLNIILNSNKNEEEKYICIQIGEEIDGEDYKIYSAIYKKNNSKGIKIDAVEADDGKKSSDFGIFTITIGYKEIKVAVVHTKEKKDEKEEGKTKKEKWEDFINKIKSKEVNYIVGDTNMTKSKIEGFDPEMWWKEEFDEGVVVPKRKIKKDRLGDPEGDPAKKRANGFLNNQISKGKGEAEIDGMVILNLNNHPIKNKLHIAGGRRSRLRKTKKNRKSKRKRRRTKKR